MRTTATQIADDTKPRIWVGCLAHYNAGQLVGEWFDAIYGNEITLADVHRGHASVSSDCEELWCLDHENIPVRGEMSPMDAAAWARVLNGVPDHQRRALCAWVESGDYVAQGDGTLPSISDFEERFVGEWESFDDYAHDYADSTGLLADAPEEIARYFNWKSWISDVAMEFTTVDAPNGGVYVFRSL